MEIDCCLVDKHKMKNILLILLAFVSIQVFAQDNQSITLAYEYYNQGEREKALEIFDKLAANPANVPFIHERYLELILGNLEYEKAEKYLIKLKNSHQDNYQYWIDLGSLFYQQDQEDKMEATFTELILVVKQDQNRTRFVATTLYNANFSKFAIQTYLSSREVLKSGGAYAMDLATLYRLTNQKELMIEEYFNFLKGNPVNLNFVKDQLQNSLTEEEDLPKFRSWLIGKIQEDPNDPNFPEMLIWVNVQMKDFTQAFIQARAFDRRFQNEDSKVFDTGVIAYQNEEYEQAEKFFQFYVDEFTYKQNYLMARLYLIQSKEQSIKNKFPVVTNLLKSLMVDYNQLIKEIGYNNISFEAMINKSRLHAYYLNELDSAIYFLEQVIRFESASKNITAKAKIELGDILVIAGQPWESSLLYSQVEKSNKGENIGFESKLKNAKLSFYRGDFELSKSHLDILKEATTREIANDALDLSLLISDNMDYDSTYAALNVYSKADLAYFSNQKDRSLHLLDSLLEAYPNHPIEDESYFLKSKILLERGDFEGAILTLNSILELYPDDILADDALFQLGKIYQEQLEDLTKAMEIYQRFLRDYPSSLYVEDVRRRFRSLRGDTNTT